MTGRWRGGLGVPPGLRDHVVLEIASGVALLLTVLVLLWAGVRPLPGGPAARGQGTRTDEAADEAKEGCPEMSAEPVTFGLPGDPRKWVQCANAIAERLADGRYPDGQWLPNFTQLAAELAANPSTVDHALTTVRAKGLISLVDGVGYYAGSGEPPATSRPDRRAGPGHSRPRHAGRLTDQDRDRLPASLRELYLTATEVARLLRLSTMTVYRLVSEGAFAGAVQIGTGKGLRIPASSVDAYLKRCIVTGALDLSELPGDDDDGE